MARVAIVGAGYVGLTYGLAHAYMGDDVVVVDKDRGKVDQLRQGICPVSEKGLPELLERGLRGELEGSIFFSTDTRLRSRDAEVIVLAVWTPELPSGLSDMSQVYAAAKEIAEGMIDGREYLILDKCTVHVGTARALDAFVADALKADGKSPEFHVVANPCFTDAGNALQDVLYPMRYFVGVGPGQKGLVAAELSRAFHSRVLGQTFDEPIEGLKPKGYVVPPVQETTWENCEVMKQVANTFQAMRISFAQEVAEYCEVMGADVETVMDAAGLDPRIGQLFNRPGVGWGGPCLPKDTHAFLTEGEQLFLDMDITYAIRKVNDRQRERAILKLVKHMGCLNGRTIAVLGLAFKAGVADARFSPAVDVVRKLVELGAWVQAYDPMAVTSAADVLQLPRITYFDREVGGIQGALRGAEAVMVLTDWPEFTGIDWKELNRLRHDSDRKPVVVDGRNILNPTNVKEAGLKYIGWGRGEVSP